MARQRPCCPHGRRTFWRSIALLFIERIVVAAGENHLEKNVGHHLRPPLSVVETVLATTASTEFQGNEELYHAASDWDRERLVAHGGPGPHLACALYKDGREALLKLRGALGHTSIQRISNDPVHGTCFFAMAAAGDSVMISKDPGRYGLQTFGVFPSVLKVSHGVFDFTPGDNGPLEKERSLAVTHGKAMHSQNIAGLEVKLSPTMWQTNPQESAATFSRIVGGLMAPSLKFRSTSFWSELTQQEIGTGEQDGHLATHSRAREWGKAADLLDQLGSDHEHGSTLAETCSWDSLRVLHPNGRFLVLAGIEHLLPQSSGREDTERAVAASEDLKMACFMGLVSYFASLPEVLWVGPSHKHKLLNAVARAVSQSATISDTPLTDAGLDGTDEVIQVVDSGLDQYSCYFIDDSGEPVEMGYLYDQIAFATDGVNVYMFYEESGGYFPVDMDRRKVVQYVSLVAPNDPDDPFVTIDTYYGGTTQITEYDADGFQTETEGGHGSHTAGTAAGSSINTPAVPDECSDDEQVSCFGECLEDSYIEEATSDMFIDFDLLCDEFDCDGTGDAFEEYCLDGDTEDILTENGGVAQGAKLAIFDVATDTAAVWAALALNALWEATEGTGAMVHSNSWGSETFCEVDSMSETFDDYMYENPEHLLIFAAGNSGEDEDESCTIYSPAVGKNVLTVGASSSGPTRWTYTDDGQATIDDVASFSSFGPTLDGRIKPDIVAPGDQVLSVSSAASGTGSTCQLEVQAGTSMATPVVAGAAAMLRQYFRKSEFYETDVAARGICPSNSDRVQCDAFTPSAATLKAMLINSANLMGGDSEPDGDRGFGRVHLAAGVPVNGEGDVGLFVADSSWTSISSDSSTQYGFAIYSTDSGEFRATVAWIDPAISSLSSTQLQHDLDLTVTSPNGTVYTMWSSGESDSVNVVERVIVPSEDIEVEPGTWVVTVSAGSLTEEEQPYSLVVTGPFGEGPAVSAAFSTRFGPGATIGVVVTCVSTALSALVGLWLV